uniref:Uncharacterized protein n=1 Tax=Arundo donax TaxID=35708 RepID=A0A0A9G658_ARUDO
MSIVIILYSSNILFNCISFFFISRVFASFATLSCSLATLLCSSSSLSFSSAYDYLYLFSFFCSFSTSASLFFAHKWSKLSTQDSPL